MSGQVHVLAMARIGGRRLRFDAIFCQNRLRITMLDGAESSEAEAEEECEAGVVPEALGSVVYLDSDRPGLRISAPLHVEWAAQHCEAIIAEGVRIWGIVLRECDG